MSPLKKDTDSFWHAYTKTTTDFALYVNKNYGVKNEEWSQSDIVKYKLLFYIEQHIDAISDRQKLLRPLPHFRNVIRCDTQAVKQYFLAING